MASLTFNINLIAGNGGENPSTPLLPNQPPSEPNPSPNPNPSPSINKPTSKSSRNTTGLAVATMIGKKVIDGVSSKVGTITGNSRIQTSVSNVSTVVGLGIMAYTNPVMTAITVGTMVANTAFDHSFEQWKDQASKSQSRARAGYSNENEVLGFRH